jgi:hypothetical protein
MTTPERIYIEVLNGEITPRWTPNREDKSDVEYIRADLNASIAAREEVEDLCKKVYRLHTENARLTALLTAQPLLRAALAEGFGYIVGTDEIDGITAITVAECDAELIADEYPGALPVRAIADILGDDL